MNTLLRVLNLMDIFGATPEWKVGGTSKRGSPQGLLLSVGLLGYFIWAIVYLSGDLVNRTNPAVT